MTENPESAEKFQLFFFPFAGASFTSYNNLTRFLPKAVLDVHILELPGRGKRAREHLLSAIDKMADNLLEQIETKLNAPYAFFGHSMGSLLAYEVILRIMDRKLDLPVHLFVSGRGGPQVPSKLKDLGFLPKEAFFESLRELGGIPELVFKEKEIMDYFEPIIRADCIAAGTYIRNDIDKIPVPVTLLYGTQDTASREESLKWLEITDLDTDTEAFSGGHFFIFDHAEIIADLITQRLQKRTVVAENLT